MPTLKLAPATFEDYRALAEKRLPRRLFDYIDGGAYQEVSLRRNTTAFQDLELKQRVLTDVSQRDSSMDFLGRSWAMPVGLAPIGLAGMMARRAEVQAKRAADAAGIPFTLSTVGICSIEEVAAVSDIPFWFQLYVLRDRGTARELMQRARAVGVDTLVFTVDLPVVGARYRDVRNGLSEKLSGWRKLRGGLLSYLMHPAWLFDVGIKGKPHTFGNLEEYVPNANTPDDFKHWVDSQFDDSFSWKDLEWLRKEWTGHLVIKGILSPEDARLAKQYGADAIVISNHGGRQLDGVSSGIEMLPSIADAVEGELGLLMDGGVRNGQDVIKAKALGADAVLIGRPWVMALAAAGETGLKNYLQTLRGGLDVAMALTACPQLSVIGPHILNRRSD